jgi:hypothetical protein
MRSSDITAWSSWLLAAPATILQRRRGIVCALSALPSAHGENTSHAIAKISSSGAIDAPNSR